MATTISNLLTALEEVLPRKDKLSDAAIKLYCAVLGDIPVDLLEVAVKDILTTSKWFPTPSEIRERAANYAHPQFPTPMQAWDEIQKAIAAPDSRMVYCAEYIKLHDQIDNLSVRYMTMIAGLAEHSRTCKECHVEEIGFEFSNPIIKKMYGYMGGKALRNSEYAIADRSQFVTSYNQLVEREERERVLLPEVQKKRQELEAKNE